MIVFKGNLTNSYCRCCMCDDSGKAISTSQHPLFDVIYSSLVSGWEFKHPLSKERPEVKVFLEHFKSFAEKLAEENAVKIKPSGIFNQKEIYDNVNAQAYEFYKGMCLSASSYSSHTLEPRVTAFQRDLRIRLKNFASKNRKKKKEK